MVDLLLLNAAVLLAWFGVSFSLKAKANSNAQMPERSTSADADTVFRVSHPCFEDDAHALLSTAPRNGVIVTPAY